MKKQKPRYQPGEHPQYHAFVAHYRSKSAVLQPTSHMNAEAWSMSSKSGLMGLAEEYGAKWDNCAALVDGVDAAFEERKLRARRLGQREPAEMPADLMELKLKYQAWLDVIAEEIARIKTLLAAFLDREAQEEEDMVLRYGPMGTSRGEPTIEIDGQPCRVDEDGYPRIACKKSPFDGMKVVDYREHICNPWRDEKNRLYREAYDKSNDLDLGAGERKRAAEEAHRLVTGKKLPPWPPRPEGL